MFSFLLRSSSEHLSTNLKNATSQACNLFSVLAVVHNSHPQKSTIAAITFLNGFNDFVFKILVFQCKVYILLYPGQTAKALQSRYVSNSRSLLQRIYIQCLSTAITFCLHYLFCTYHFLSSLLQTLTCVCCLQQNGLL